MATVDLPYPAITNLDLTVTRRSAVTYDKVVGKTVGQLAHVAMVMIKDARIALAGTAVVNDDIFPPIARDPGVVNGFADRGCKVLPVSAATARCREWRCLFALARHKTA
jgi:hypothetical protein